MLLNRLLIIHKQAQELAFRQRESSRGHAIASGSILLIFTHLRSRGPGALAQPKNQFLSLFVYCICTMMIALPFQIAAVDYKPWLGEMLEFDWRNEFFYQTYPSVSVGNHRKKHSSDDLFLTTSLSTSVMEYGIELEATQASTHRQSGGIDNLRGTLRYVWLDDVAGDPISLATGFSFIQSFVPSLKDVSSFHHGRSETELFVSLGKETPSSEIWMRRWWTVMGAGIAERGSPWLRFNLGYDFRSSSSSNHHEWRLFCHTLWGLGERKLNVNHFSGYGAIEHQSVDLGLRYTFLIDYFGSISFQYSNRIYARNFPSQTSVFLLEWLYTFGL